jgi:hypothetical protein
MIVNIDKTVPAFESYAAERTRGLYNVDVEDGQRFRLDVDVPVEENDWRIGVVVGPSGSGKTSIAEALHEHDWQEYSSDDWPLDTPLIEVLERMSDAGDPYAKATAALAAVGLGSVPSWLRPASVLSNGEFFRANLAALLLDTDYSQVYIDEFSSVLDRQVAKVGAGAFAKAWRKQPDRKIILITPHYDILEWVQPDWWIDTAEGLDEFAADRGVVQAREGEFQEASHRARYRGNRLVTLEC